jgi:predicted acyl esterase
MQEMPLGQTEKVEIELYATAVLIKKGHKVRLSIGGHDDSNFSRFPEEETPTFTIVRDSNYPSRIILPTIEKGETV